MCQLVITFFILCKILLTCHYFFYISVSYCPIPPSVANGYIIQSSGVKYGGNVTYECNEVVTCQQDFTQDEKSYN
jgi:hypothetical protein